jgi:hypothetical protein
MKKFAMEQKETIIRTVIGEWGGMAKAAQPVVTPAIMVRLV